MKKDKKAVIFIVILLVISLILLSTIYYTKYILPKNVQNENNTDQNSNENTTNTESKNDVQKQVKIFKGSDRVVAVMIDNEKLAWPHSGLNDAYMIYEILIEGGESRMMALFKGVNTEKIGPVRSSRHYFVKYALENNAIYTHYGWSPEAMNIILAKGVNNINGITSDGKIFWRVGSGYHNAYTSIAKILELSKEKKYLTISSQGPLYNIQAEEYNLENGTEISDIYLKYSDLHNVSYKYDTDKKVFLRSMRGIKDIDRETKEQYYAKNIIIIQADNYTLNDGENKGRQEVKIVGQGTGYFVTNGKYINITWKKADDQSKTYIYDSNNQEIILNDGITYVQVVPTGDNVKFTELGVE